ncbi:hypothetical protein FBU30_010122 [Linnemannia zychae]|nr:hypothetical protein FBU30_010122 [Linnemannia zychae]
MLYHTSSCTLFILSTLTFVSHISVIAHAHSWAACIDWRFKNPDKPGWEESDGECHGFARRYPLKGEIWSLDSADPGRHYQQDESMIPCSDGIHGKDKGSDERRANPVEDAYGGKWGPMTHTRVGDTLCIRWPAKNHAEKNEDYTEVLINMAQLPNRPDPSQAILTDNLVKRLPYKKCDSGHPDHRGCGGCFKVPVRSSGIYLLQWRWQLNPGEWYTSCADVAIGV